MACAGNSIAREHERTFFCLRLLDGIRALPVLAIDNVEDAIRWPMRWPKAGCRHRGDLAHTRRRSIAIAKLQKERRSC
jgi:hypothetical protein